VRGPGGLPGVHQRPLSELAEVGAALGELGAAPPLHGLALRERRGGAPRGRRAHPTADRDSRTRSPQEAGSNTDWSSHARSKTKGRTAGLGVRGVEEEDSPPWGCLFDHGDRAEQRRRRRPRKDTGNRRGDRRGLV